SEDEHPDVTLSRGDCVIFSSRTIPGNEKAVAKIINGLVRQGIEVITDRTHLVHVSGHPRRDEMKELYSWVKPEIVVPVHGEALHLAEHAALARKLGIKQAVECQNGDMVRLAPGPVEIVDELPEGRFYKDGKLIADAEARTVADRRRLGFVGVVSVALALDSAGTLVTDPELDLIGIPETNADGAIMSDIARDAVIETLAQLPRPRRR